MDQIRKALDASHRGVHVATYDPNAVYANFNPFSSGNDSHVLYANYNPNTLTTRERSSTLIANESGAFCANFNPDELNTHHRSGNNNGPRVVSGNSHPNELKTHQRSSIPIANGSGAFNANFNSNTFSNSHHSGTLRGTIPSQISANRQSPSIIQNHSANYSGNLFTSQNNLSALTPRVPTTQSNSGSNRRNIPQVQKNDTTGDINGSESGKKDETSKEKIYKQFKKDGGNFNRTPVHQPYQQQQVSHQISQNQRNSENLNQKRPNPSLPNPTNNLRTAPLEDTEDEEEYFKMWKKNIELESQTQKKNYFKYIDQNSMSAIAPQSYSVIFQKFLKPENIKVYLKNVKGLDRVRCRAQSEMSILTYQGNITDLKPSKNSILIKITFSQQRFSEIQEYFEKSQNLKWKIEDDQPDFYDQMKENLEKLKQSPEHKNIFIKKEKPQWLQELDSETERGFLVYASNNQELNQEQKNAILECLITKNYNLVLGMPGTGKTTVIVILLKILMQSQKKVLVTGYTHAAIDNILKRFVEKYPTDKDKVARLGDKTSIDPEVRDLVKESDDSQAMIFAVTCHGAVKFQNEREFDTCIVDEASQIVVPVLLGPLLKAKHFILFGDHHQLPPLVKSEEAQRNGMAISLFEELAKEHGDSIVSLTTQYRMNKRLMEFSNSLIYGGRMTCGNEKVEKGNLFPGSLSQIKWLSNILSPNQSVVFLDLSKVKALHNESTRNLNSKLTCYLARYLKENHWEEEDIGIISPLNFDKDSVEESLKDLKNLNRYTIDTCQGIDRKCIIMNISLNTNSIRKLLSSPKRINVAFTRAKHKLIIIGSYHDLMNMDGIKDWIGQIDESEREIFDAKMLHEANIVKIFED